MHLVYHCNLGQYDHFVLHFPRFVKLGLFGYYLPQIIIAECIYRLVMMSIDLSETAHFGHYLHGRNCNPNYNCSMW